MQYSWCSALPFYQPLESQLTGIIPVSAEKSLDFEKNALTLLVLQRNEAQAESAETPCWAWPQTVG